MKVQLWRVLIMATVGNQAITASVQLKLMYQALYSVYQIMQKVSSLRWHIQQPGIVLFGYQQDVKWIARLGMIEGNERVSVSRRR